MGPVLCPVVVGRDDELRLLAASIDAALEKIGPHLKGRDFYCTCPFGEHAFYMVLEGDSFESVIAGLPAEWRPGTRAVPLEIFKLPD